MIRQLQQAFHETLDALFEGQPRRAIRLPDRYIQKLARRVDQIASDSPPIARLGHLLITREVQHNTPQDWPERYLRTED